MGIPTPQVQKRFYEIFGKPVNQFWNIAGFDIVKFDEFLLTPDGVSTEQFIRDNYGAGAVELVRGLL
jgi:hypothetical protein